MSKALLAFYSRADENYVNGMMEMLEIGNTEVAAGMIRELTGADWFPIRQVKPYAKDYNTCIAQAQEDQRQNDPALSAPTRAAEWGAALPI